MIGSWRQASDCRLRLRYRPARAHSAALSLYESQKITLRQGARVIAETKD